MRCILLTGANGVLGTNLLHRFLSQSKVIVVSCNPNVVKARFSNFSNLSCFSWNELDGICWDQVDFVVHCAFSRTLEGKELTKSLELTCKQSQIVHFYYNIYSL